MLIDGLKLRVFTSQRPSDAPSAMITIPKNRSTGNLFAIAEKDGEDKWAGPSFDAGNAKDFNSAAFPSILSEQEHSLGVNGLQRIRQHPPSRAPSQPPSPHDSFTLPKRSASITMSGTSGRAFSPGSLSSPTLNLGEDLSRFPSESLHSFSFTHQSEDILHSRQNLLKRSIDFMCEKLGWSTNHPRIMAAQAKVSGDAEIQGMMELLAKANVLGDDISNVQRLRAVNGPLTGPADMDGLNIFDKAFTRRPSQIIETVAQDTTSENREFDAISGRDLKQPESSLECDTSTSLPINDSSTPKPTDAPKQRAGLRRTNTDLSLITLQTKLVEVLARPYVARENISDNALLSPTPNSAFNRTFATGLNLPSIVHGHTNRWSPAAQAIFTTEADSPWTILAANDLACLVFGVTKAEVKKLGILEVVREDRRSWLEERLRSPGSEAAVKVRSSPTKSTRTSPNTSNSLLMKGGVTAHLLSKPSSRQIANKRAQGEGQIEPKSAKQATINERVNHKATKSRGVLLCGDIVPIQKRNGNTGSASLWVKEKRGGLIWVLEEIIEDVVTLNIDSENHLVEIAGASETIWGENKVLPGTDIQQLIPKLPTLPDSEKAAVDLVAIDELQYFTAHNSDGVNIPTSITTNADSHSLRVSSFPHIAGIMVLSAKTLQITSSNSVFSAALFGYSNPDGLKINQLIPQFDKILDVLTEEDEAVLADGVVIPEHSFRRARAVLALREGNADATAIFLRPTGLVAQHRDGCEINVDIQMRVVKSEKPALADSIIKEKMEGSSEILSDNDGSSDKSEVVFALWVTYSRHLHSGIRPGGSSSPAEIRPSTPHHPSPGQVSRSDSPQVNLESPPKSDKSPSPSLAQQIQEAASQPISDVPARKISVEKKPAVTKVVPKELPKKKKISDYVTLEDMGQGAYGQVKLARHIATGKKVVLKYVTKRRILVDTWTRDRRLGTVPLEIHVLDYLRKEELRHPNIVEMIGFFEDDINYYIEMLPHGLPGMDLFDYIEMRTTIDEAECRNIFLQVAAALHHLHTKALVVHRDIKDENIILDGDSKVKLIDFGSAAYIKNGPFDVFVGTIGNSLSLVLDGRKLIYSFVYIDYAAPEVLQGKSYRGKEQDVWALGILLYTLVYKENPFYSIDEIMDRELRIPWVMSDASIDLIKAMLNRDVDQRLTITQVLEHSWCKLEDED